MVDRRNLAVNKEEPHVLWQDKHVAVILKGPAWIVALSRNIEQNRFLSSLLQTTGGKTREVHDIVTSGKCEHLCHFLIQKFKDNKEYELSDSLTHEFGIAHRLDVDTSGALMLGKTETGFVHLRTAFTVHEIFKEYICLVHGAVRKVTAQVDAPIAWDEHNNISYVSDTGQWAKSIYTVLGHYRLRGGNKIFTLCRVVIITGRTHQIRVHMCSIGHPIVGDSKYNRRQASTDFMWCPRTFLHAWRVGFWDTARNWVEVKAPLTKDLTRSLRALEGIRVDAESVDNPAIRLVRPGPPQQPPPQHPGTASATGSALPPPPPMPPPPMPHPGQPADPSGRATHPSGLSRFGSVEEEKKYRNEFPPPPPPSGANYDKACDMLVDMGFDRQASMQALRSNYGDITEAMDQLALSLSKYRPAHGADGLPGEAGAKQAPGDEEPAGPNDADKEPGVEQPPRGDEEAMLEQILAASRREEEARKRRQALDEEAVAAALAQSLQQDTSGPGEEDDQLQQALEQSQKLQDKLGQGGAGAPDEEADNQLREALEQSQKLQEECRMQEQREEEELERAVHESIWNYEVFHTAGDEAFEETLRQSLAESRQQDAMSAEEDRLLQDAIQRSYNEGFEGDEDDEEVLFSCHLAGPTASYGGGQARGSSSSCDAPWFPPGPEPGTTKFDDVPEVDDMKELLLQHARELQLGADVEAPPPPVTCTKEWLLKHAAFLHVDIDGEVLWGTLNAIDEEQLNDFEAVKMWFGYGPGEDLPDGLAVLAAEFRERRRLERSLEY